MAKEQQISLVSQSLEIFLVFSGSVEVTENQGNRFKRNKGEAWVSFDGADFEVKSLEDATIYRASIPGMN
jgi:hypothetical protein